MSAAVWAESYSFALDHGLSHEEADAFSALVVDSGLGRDAAINETLGETSRQVLEELSITKWGRFQVRIYRKVLNMITDAHRERFTRDPS